MQGTAVTFAEVIDASLAVISSELGRIAESYIALDQTIKSKHFSLLNMRISAFEFSLMVFVLCIFLSRGLTIFAH